MTKRLFDIFFSFLGLSILTPLFLILAILIKIDSKGPVFYRQTRVGKDFKEFKIYKFRSMIYHPEGKGPQVTVGGDKRVTKVGKFLRRYKIDEFPQLINVLVGEMSFVGPRPEVRKYVDLFKDDYQKLLRIRPGITDLASVTYSREESLLASSANWEDDYIQKVLPEKIKLSEQYVDSPGNVLADLRLIIKTIFKI